MPYDMDASWWCGHFSRSILMKTAPLDIGCSVTGIDAAWPTKAQIKKLRDLLCRNRLIVLKNQNLDEAPCCKLRPRRGRCCGTPSIYLQA